MICRTKSNVICVCLMERYYISHRRKSFHGNGTLPRPHMHLCSSPFKDNEQQAQHALPILCVHLTFLFVYIIS